MIFSSREDVIAMTSQWQGERYEDGRPKVADACLDALYDMTLEELWKPIYTLGYEHQFVSIQSLYPEFSEDGMTPRKLVGRALTAIYAPTRPDFYENMMNTAHERGLNGTPNQWVIESLRHRDVLVVDMFDKVFKGTFLGGNLTTAVKEKTETGGAVIWGGIRDVEQMKKIGVQVYYRGIDPTPIREFVMTGMNVPARIGDGREAAICLPGDVVFGCGGGVLFIPPHVAEAVVENGAKTQVKDIFGFDMISQNKFTTVDIDKNVWSKEMLDLLMDFIATDPRAEKYRSLDWSNEYAQAETGAGDNSSAL